MFKNRNTQFVEEVVQGNTTTYKKIVGCYLSQWYPGQVRDLKKFYKWVECF